MNTNGFFPLDKLHVTDFSNLDGAKNHAILKAIAAFAVLAEKGITTYKFMK